MSVKYSEDTYHIINAHGEHIASLHRPKGLDDEEWSHNVGIMRVRMSTIFGSICTAEPEAGIARGKDLFNELMGQAASLNAYINANPELAGTLSEQIDELRQSI